MKLLRVHVISAQTCGGLLDGFDIQFRSQFDEDPGFDPICVLGCNGAGKSQFLQVLAEMFQSAYFACVKEEERFESNPDILFELEYLICRSSTSEPSHIRISRKADGKHAAALLIERMVDGEWICCKPSMRATRNLLPRKVVGYTSGDNETLSLPFLVSRSGYAEEVGLLARDLKTAAKEAPDARLMLIDYGTHLEVLVANLLLGDLDQRASLLQHAKLADLHSFRCIIQLAHGAAPKTPPRNRRPSKFRKGVQLTDELETYIDYLLRCATCYDYDEETETYILDFWVNDQTRKAFRTFWKNSFELYTSLHKLAMLNDLAIPRPARRRFSKANKERRFASRLPEPQDENKIFRFERVRFVSQKSDDPVDYVSLSDGEHQLAQLLGTLCMVAFPGVLFLLDEPESHFNPQWRVKCISQILALPTDHGNRQKGEAGKAADQECLISTHSPFLPSDMVRERVFIFEKVDQKLGWRNPEIETYGSTFDAILEDCFRVRPPISQVPMNEIERLKKSENPAEIQEGIDKLGYSVEKVFLADHLRQVKNKPRG